MPSMTVTLRIRVAPESADMAVHPVDQRFGPFNAEPRLGSTEDVRHHGQAEHLYHFAGHAAALSIQVEMAFPMSAVIITSEQATGHSAITGPELIAVRRDQDHSRFSRTGKKRISRTLTTALDILTPYSLSRVSI